MRTRYYVGLSTTFHDPALAIVGPDGEVRFAEAVERYLQDKRAFQCTPDHLLRLPSLLRRYCEPGAELVGALTFSELSLRILQVGVVADLTPLRTLGDRLSDFIDDRSYHDLSSWPHPPWTTMRQLQRGVLTTAGVALQGSREIPGPVELRRYNHHLTHAAYACHSSPFSEAVCAVIDGYGEFGSTGFYRYRGGKLEPLHRKRTPVTLERASLGLLYGLVTGLCGFSVLKGEEWKVMGLAPYGKPDPQLYDRLRSLVRVKGLGLEPGLSLADEKQVLASLQPLRRDPEAPPIAAADIAATGQKVFADLMRELLSALRSRGISDNLVLTGGCALNSACNGTIVGEVGFDALHVPSAPADDGNAIGAALLAYREDHPDAPAPRRVMSPFLGSEIATEVLDNLVRFNASSRVRRLGEGIVEAAAERLAQGKIIGWMQGRAEFGPRALGHRSILADPRAPDMKDRINARVKFREEYRPFAPSILHEHGPEYFEDYQPSPYMDRTLRFRAEVRARVPAVVHENGTGRLQSVTPELTPRFHALIRAFQRRTGIPLLLNTSFNIMGKPIIHSVEDAVGMFYTTGLDAVVIDDVLIEKE